MPREGSTTERVLAWARVHDGPWHRVLVPRAVVLAGKYDPEELWTRGEPPVNHRALCNSTAWSASGAGDWDYVESDFAVRTTATLLGNICPRCRQMSREELAEAVLGAGGAG